MLRFIAFAAVFCHHFPHPIPAWFVWVVSCGGLGLPVFFLLSAYLIVTLLLREKDQTSTIDLKAFAARRALRIWPLYFLMIGIFALIGWHRPALHLTRHALIAYTFLLANVYAIRNGWSSLGVMGALWSISVEEQFYLCVPLVTRLGGRRALVCVSTLALLLAYAVLWRMGATGREFWDAVWPNSFVQFQFFGAGALIAVLQYQRPVELPGWARGVLFLLWPSSWAAAFQVWRSWGPAVVPSGRLMAGFEHGMVGCVALFYSVLGVQARMPRSLVYLGKISYGLYVFHGPCLWLVFSLERNRPGRSVSVWHTFAGCGLALLLTIGTAALSYQYFEKPILKYKEGFERIKTRPA